ncbi:GNAT family N-acetyltransferase [Shewanella sp.]|uniref:GNAT family N-acetyltransferase n=1 Tax=Shewanella sp. TaxID=50422 RepID=UPI0040538CFC
MIELYSERLMLRSLLPSDWANFLMINQNKDINAFVRQVETLEQIRIKFEQKLEPWEFESGDWLTLVIEELATGEFVGFSGFNCANLTLRRAEVGYLLSAEHQGKGYATEALQGVIDWGAHAYSIHNFIGLCDVRNLGSAKVMMKCGFKQEGRLRENNKIGESWSDDYLFGLLVSERVER